MVIVSSFELNNNNSTGIFTITAKELVNCPLCGGGMSYRDSKRRMVKNLLGEIRLFLLRRLHCRICEKLHTELPSIIQPYKHYNSDAIQSILDGGEDGLDCVADDSTIRRWKTEFAKAQPDINQRLTSVYAQMTGEKVPIAATVNILDKIKIEVKPWLAFVMVLLINNGHKLCTRFAFCHSQPPDTVSDVVNTMSKEKTEGGKKDDKTIKDSG